MSSGATRIIRICLLLAGVVVVGTLSYIAWGHFQPTKLPVGFAASNGRIEAVEIDIAAKTPGRLDTVLVDEGDFVTAGQVLARMDTDVLEAQLREAQANLAQAKSAVKTAQSTVIQRESEKAAASALLLQREAELDLATKRYERGKRLVQSRAMSVEEFDTERSTFHSARATRSSAKANMAGADAAIATAQSQILRAEAEVAAAKAKVDRVQEEIKDCALRSPRDGRVQFRIAQAGEVLPAGGKVLNMLDLADVYMTFFLPTASAGRVSLGAEVRLVLDAAPNLVIPARATFVADIAQFTPKTVETAAERQKLMFRIKARIAPSLLKKYIRSVKTGLPGMAYVQLDPEAPWPARLEVNLPQ